MIMSRLASRLICLLCAAAFAGCTRSTPTGDRPVIAAPTKPDADVSSNNKRDVVKLTSAAASKVHEFQKQTGNRFLRVSVKGGGNTGYMYDMGMTNERSENDFVGNADGIQILVDKKSSIFLDGATIDWQTTPDGKSGFHFDNPNAVKQ